MEVGLKQRHAQGRKMCLWQTSYLNAIKIHSTGSQPFMCHTQSRFGHTLGFQLNHLSLSFQPVHVLELGTRSMVRMGNPTSHRSLILQSVATPNVCAWLLSPVKSEGCYLACSYCGCTLGTKYCFRNSGVKLTTPHYCLYFKSFLNLLIKYPKALWWGRVVSFLMWEKRGKRITPVTPFLVAQHGKLELLYGLWNRFSAIVLKAEWRITNTETLLFFFF